MLYYVLVSRRQVGLVHLPDEVMVDALRRRPGLEAERQSPFEGFSMASGDEFVLGGTTFGLRALRRQQVPEAGRAANQLSGSGEFEALGDGLFGLLHGGSG